MGNNPRRVPAIDRRNFLRFSLGTSMSAFGMSHAALAQQTVAENKKPKSQRTKSIIILWMGGGPTHIDTWDPKPGNANGGEFKPITAAPGMQFTELLPRCAKVGKHMTVIRSVATGEGAHERGTSLMHIGMTPIQGQPIPPMGSIVAYENGIKDHPLPYYVAMRPPAIPQGNPFGDEYLPFPLNNASDPIPNVKSTVAPDRDRERAKLLLAQNEEWSSTRKQKMVDRVRKAYVKSEDIMTTPLLKAFDYGSEPASVREKYSGRFGTNCLLARRLVEVGVPAIEIGLGGWDMHNQVGPGCKRLVPQVDAGMGSLIEDLAERNLLDDTLVVWMGEFGRTPNINGTQGRDHWARGFSVAMAGGALKRRGFAYGSTGPSGMGCIKPVDHRKLFATIYKAVGIDYRKKYYADGRKIGYTTNTSEIKELF